LFGAQIGQFEDAVQGTPEATVKQFGGAHLSIDETQSAKDDRLDAASTHFRKVLRIQEERESLTTERDLLAGVFNASGLGFVLLDQTGGVLVTTKPRKSHSGARARACREGRTATRRPCGG